MNFKTSLLISGALAAYMSPQIDPDTTALSDSEPHPIVQSTLGCSAIGPYKDKIVGRAFHYRSLYTSEENPLTYEQCRDSCSEYQYFALQADYYECWCDNDIDKITQYGEGNCGEGGAGLCNYVYECDDLERGTAKILYVDDHTSLSSGLYGREKGSCISFNPELQRNLGRYAGLGGVELWVTVTSDPTQCALVEFEMSNNSDEYYIFMKGRVDGAPIIPGYLSTRGESVDERVDESGESYYMSATQEKISTFKLEELKDGYAFYQNSNSNGKGEFYYLHAITSAGDPIQADGYTSDLILRNYQYSQASIFEIDSLFEDKATKVMAAMMTLLALISYV